jgi:hypothetical protein
MRPSGCARCKAAARSFSVGHWTHTDGHQRLSKFGPERLLKTVGCRSGFDREGLLSPRAALRCCAPSGRSPLSGSAAQGRSCPRPSTATPRLDVSVTLTCCYIQFQPSKRGHQRTRQRNSRVTPPPQGTSQTVRRISGGMARSKPSFNLSPESARNRTRTAAPSQWSGQRPLISFPPRRCCISCGTRHAGPHRENLTDNLLVRCDSPRPINCQRRRRYGFIDQDEHPRRGPRPLHRPATQRPGAVRRPPRLLRGQLQSALSRWIVAMRMPVIGSTKIAPLELENEDGEVSYQGRLGRSQVRSRSTPTSSTKKITGSSLTMRLSACLICRGGSS